MRPRHLFLCAALLAAATHGLFAFAKGAEAPGVLPGANSKEPISIDADKLVYLDKDQKAIYSGNVVAIQGATKFTCSEMTLTLLKTEPDASGAPAPSAGPAPAPGGTQLNHMDAAGPVTIVSKTQVATGDKAAYDKPSHKFWLTGNVTLSDGGNVTKGDKLTYDLSTGQASVEGHPKSLFTPGAGDDLGKGKPAK